MTRAVNFVTSRLSVRSVLTGLLLPREPCVLSIDRSTLLSRNERKDAVCIISSLRLPVVEAN